MSERLPSNPTTVREVAVIAGLLSGLLLVLAVPRLLATLQSIEARAVVWDLFSDSAVSPARLADGAAALAAGNGWILDGESEGDRSLLLMELAQTAKEPGERKRLMEAAESAAVSALRSAPGQPSVWYRLASLREQREDLDGAVAALRMSMLAGPFVPALVIPRVEQGLRLLPGMDTDTIDLFKRQIRLAWVITPDFVAALSARPGVGELTREALADLSGTEMEQFRRLHGARQ